jgi:hypothetical protein
MKDFFDIPVQVGDEVAFHDTYGIGLGTVQKVTKGTCSVYVDEPGLKKTYYGWSGSRAISKKGDIKSFRSPFKIVVIP